MPNIVSGALLPAPRTLHIKSSSCEAWHLPTRGWAGGPPGPSQPKPGPSLAQARFLEIWKSGTWKSGNLGSNKFPQNNFKIEIRSAQNVGKVWISRKKNIPALFGAIPGHFLRGPEKCKTCQNFAYLPLLCEI